MVRLTSEQLFQELQHGLLDGRRHGRGPPVTIRRGRGGEPTAVRVENRPAVATGAPDKTAILQRRDSVARRGPGEPRDAAARPGQRSISPMTMSIEPTIAGTS